MLLYHGTAHFPPLICLNSSFRHSAILVLPSRIQYDATITTHRTLHVYTVTFLGQALTMYGGGLLEKKIGARTTALLGTVLISGGTFAASFCTTLHALVLSQAVVGLGIGTAYSAPILCCFKHFSTNKALVTGIITTGTGFGPFLFGLIAAAYVNPENLPTDVVYGLFPLSCPVVQRVPGMFRLLAACYAACGLLGASLLSDPIEFPKSDGVKFDPKIRVRPIGNGHGESAPMLPSGTGSSNTVPSYDDLLKINPNFSAMQDNGHADEIEKGYGAGGARTKSIGKGHKRYGSRVKFKTTYDLSTSEMVRDSLCWLVIAGAICSGTVGFYVAASFKSFGQPYIKDDHFLTAVGGLGCLCSGLSRTFWGSMADCLGTFRTVEIVSYASPIAMVLYTLSPDSRGAFGFLVCSLYALWGANYCLYPPIAAFLFGEKNMGTNYGFIFFVFGIVSTFLIDICGYTSISFRNLNFVFAGLGFVGALLNSQLRYLTTDIKDETIMKHHRATSSVGSIF